MDSLAAPPEPVFGHELISLLARMGGRATVETLRQAAHRAFGPAAVYGNCHGDRFSFEEVLAFLASRGKLAVTGDDVSLGAVPACDGH
ncbi:MAG TPA: DUF2492 family protein [Thermoanaerobaculia bacterium]|nr:DUF2492 family protein [Thermoanaerobaculia bacterium]